MAGRRLPAALIVAGALAGCAGHAPPPAPPVVVRTVETAPGLDIPVPTRREPPGELLAPIRPEPVPEFLPPTDPSITSGLTAGGESALLLLILELKSRVRAWEEWAKSP